MGSRRFRCLRLSRVSSWSTCSLRYKYSCCYTQLALAGLAIHAGSPVVVPIGLPPSGCQMGADALRTLVIAPRYSLHSVTFGLPIFKAGGIFADVCLMRRALALARELASSTS